MKKKIKAQDIRYKLLVTIVQTDQIEDARYKEKHQSKVQDPDNDTDQDKVKFRKIRKREKDGDEEERRKKERSKGKARNITSDQVRDERQYMREG